MTTFHPLPLLAVALTAALTVAGCSSPPDTKAQVDSGVSTTLAVPGSTQPAPAPTTATTATKPPTSRAPSTTRPPAASQSIVLRPDGLGVARLGDPAGVAVARLTEKLGPPEYDGAPSNPCSSKVTRHASWRGLTVMLGTTFLGYDHSGSADDPQYATEAGIGLRSTVGELKQAYGSKLKLNPGEEGTPFTVALSGGTLKGTASGPQSTDAVYAIKGGVAC